jgi:hypothetical protein
MGNWEGGFDRRERKGHNFFCWVENGYFAARLVQQTVVLGSHPANCLIYQLKVGLKGVV